MTRWLDALLGDGPLRAGDEGVRLAFETPLPAWAWALLCLGGVGLGWLSYRRLEGPLAARLALGAARTGLLLLLALLACGPKLVRPNEAIEPDWVLMLVDRSASMAIADAPSATASEPSTAGPRRTRDEQLRAAWASQAGALEAVSRDRVVRWLGFDAGVFELPDPPTIPAAGEPSGAGSTPAALAVPAPTPTPPSGARSDLGRALDQALAQAAGRPLSGIVVFSDGRASDTASRAVLRRLAAERAPVVAVALGSDEPLSDWSVRAVSGPGVAFAGDVVPVEAVVERSGTDASPSPRLVELVDNRTGLVLDVQRLEPSSAAGGPAGGGSGVWSQRVTLTSTPGSEGVADWSVRVRDESGRPDLIAGNDAAPLRVEVVDRPLRVVYFDGSPRWEYRYLQAILTRERSVASTALLLAPGRRYVQEGNTPIDAVPADERAWNGVDVLVMGDVKPEVFSPEQREQIRRRVAVGGAGLLWIAGESAVPGAWRASPLGDLLPFTGEASSLGAAGAPGAGAAGSAEATPTWDVDVTLAPTPLAQRLGVLRLMREPDERGWWPPALSQPDLGWPRLRWAQRIEPSSLKPAAEVLALAVPVSSPGDASAGTPAVLSMRYGAGRVIYVATDEVWRWRFGRGEDYPERFWLQLIRLLGREAVARGGRSALLTATPARAELGQSVRVVAEPLEQALIDSAGATMTVRVRRLGATPTPTLAPTTATAPKAGVADPDPDALDPTDQIDLTLRPTATRVDQPDRRDRSERLTYAATWTPSRSGTYRLELLDAQPGPSSSAGVAGAEPAADRAVTTEVEVFLSNDELRRPETDHALLASLARETGGALLTPGQLDRLPELLPRREVRVALAPDERTLWDTPLALAVLLTLLTLEWIGRRLIRLV